VDLRDRLDRGLLGGVLIASYSVWASGVRCPSYSDTTYAVIAGCPLLGRRQPTCLPPSRSLARGLWGCAVCTRSAHFSLDPTHRLQDARNGASDSEHKRLLWLEGYWRVSDTDVYFLLLLTALRSGRTVGSGCKTSRSKDRSPTRVAVC